MVLHNNITMAERISGRTPDYSIISRISYGIGEFFIGGSNGFINLFYVAFLIKAFGMPVALAGTVPLVGKIWDAISDPIMGNITDRTRSKFGPKRFYILIGSVLSSISFVLMWLMISTNSVTLMYIFSISMYCLFSTGYTIYFVPYNGLLPDMMDEYKIRAKFSNTRMICSSIGALSCGIGASYIIKDNQNPLLYTRCAILFGILFFIASITVFFGTWEKQKEPVRFPFREIIPQTISVFKNRSFRLFLCIYLFEQCGIDVISGMTIYYVDDVLNAYNNNYFTYCIAVRLTAQLLSMFIFGPIMNHTSKKYAIMIGGPVRLVGIIGLYLFSHEGAGLIPILCMMALIGIGHAGSLTGVYAIMADMADVDELITSERRPGVVSGVISFVRKLASGMSAAMIGFLMALVGYDEVLASSGLRQTAFTQRGIILIFILLPAILSFLLIIFNHFFPITEKEYNMVIKDIARRHGRETEPASKEEKNVLESVTGFSYDKLWGLSNITFE